MIPWADVYLPPTQRQTIIDQVCAKHGVTHEELTGHRRTQSLVDARHECWWQLYSEEGLSQSEIARMFHVDYSSVRYALKKRLVRVGE